ncbi:unnamed protein product [Nesidiocoris tenuis]|uniref:CRAL-TRIO domain-containing protein n=1 Tax=Nesidiocoris tenuis TaxID=355587 RepID=A0A6H5HFV7_9HEMI|nr:unnamed protein product [Nesidiocoris tenuis]
MSTEYKGPLSVETRKIAKDELREDDNSRAQALRQMRDWIEKNPKIISCRTGVFDPYKFINEDMCRVHGIVYETLMEDEENQVRGFVHYADGAGVSLPYLTLFTPKEAVRIVKNGERTLPMRHKEVHVINVPSSLKYVLDWGMTLISDKIKKRVKIYTTAEEAANNLDVSMLPKEYGGTIPMSEMIGLSIENLHNTFYNALTNSYLALQNCEDQGIDR